MITVKRVIWTLVITIAIAPFTIALGQSKTAALHEITPFAGFYAPDRFETSLTIGVRYYYQIDKRYSVGAIIGFARSKQDFLRRANGLNLLPGSDRVVYHGARATYTFLNGKVEPYALMHLGLTRLYDENSFTYGFGIGTKVSLNPKVALRYEFLNYIFSSGRNGNAWTNKNIEVSLGFGYSL
jgi:outer membrane beta-barrel protein